MKRVAASRLVLASVALLACKGTPSAPPDASTDAGTSAFDPALIARAEDGRRAKEILPEVRTSHDVTARRRSARALARIADAESIEGLTTHLADEDRETTAWAAYGLGYACKGREEAHVRMLAARAASLAKPAPDAVMRAARGASELEPENAIARAIARCAGRLSEAVLTSMLTSAPPQTAWSTAALLGLGDLATRRKQLGAEAITALVEAATSGTKPQDTAFYGLSRIDPGEQARRVVDAARVALGRPGESRILAIRSLGRAGKDSPKDVAPDLQRVVVDAKGYGHGERAEAARSLAGLGDAGQLAIASAIAELTPDAKDPIAIADLAGPSFHVLHTLLSSLGPEAPKKAEAALGVMANLTPPMQPNPGFARRIAELRCTAALALARGAHDAEILKKCAEESSEPSQRARLTSLLRRPITPERLTVLRTFAKSEHLRIREAVIEALGAHPEVGEAGPALLADALSSKHAGLVATAAEILNAHPERALVLAESEKRAALDPRSPPPTANPAQELAPVVAKALSAAIASPWPEDRFETRIAIVEAAVSVHHPQAKEVATALCKDKNPVMHERALKALRALGAPTAPCDTPNHELKLAAEIGQTLAKPAKLVLSTDAGELALTLEPELSPITTMRLASLVKTGFFKGVVVHRVVPGFVVQLGDPEGDGYGGSGTSLRCETSPVPFQHGDVGMALAGRDTGSSQFFVTLSRTPHLDGEYTRVGHADGDWESVAQGDVVNDAKIIE